LYQSGRRGGQRSVIGLLSLLLSIIWWWRRSFKVSPKTQQKKKLWFLFILLGLISLTESTYINESQAQVAVQTELHASLLSDTPDRSVLASTYGWGVRSGYRWGPWMAIAHIEQNVWMSAELSNLIRSGVLNAGVGGAYTYGDDVVRTSVVIGTSTLLFDTLFDQSGTTGLFVDLRPIELSWRPSPWLALNLSPLSFTYVSPVLESPPIKMVLYRTVIGLEANL